MTSQENVHLMDKIAFPTWKEVFSEIVKQFCAEQGLDEVFFQKVSNELFRQLDTIRPEVLEDGIGFFPEHAYRQMSKLSNQVDLPSHQQLFAAEWSNMKFGANEFYTVFDVIQNEHTVVDPRIEQVLGIHPKDFTFAALSGKVPEHPLYHPQDLNHAVRSAILCYFMVCFPGFEWVAHQDFFRSRFRVSTVSSTIPELRAQQYVMLEKRAYVLVDQVTGPQSVPLRHFNRWTVYEPHEFNGIQPYLSSTPFQTKYRNLMYFVLNAHLVGLSVKSVYLLHQRMHFDRNKSIANHVNEQIARYHSLRYEFTENQIGDAFAKTIRGNVAQAIRYWEGLEEKPEVFSDLEALHLAKRLCLTPMPPMLQELIVRNVCIGS